jgi:uncharacterized protein (TIGR00251 family)
MKINVKVIPNAKKNKIEKINDTYKIHLTAPAIQGKANNMLIEILSEHFNVKKNKIFIIKGEKNRNKVIEIIE